MDKNPPADRRAKITPEQREEIVRRRAAGESLAGLAKEYGISRQRVDVIAKRQKQPSKRKPELSDLTPEQLEWLRGLIAQSQRRWTLAAVEKAVLKKFGIHMKSAPHITWLVEMGVKVGRHDKFMPLSPQFEEYMRSDAARELRAREAVWRASQKPDKPRRGRPRKQPEPPAPPPDVFAEEEEYLLPLEDADDAPMECLTLEEMRASVEATRRKLAAAGKPAPPISAWGTKPFPGRSHGVRTGKHAKGWQPPKKKKRKKR